MNRSTLKYTSVFLSEHHMSLRKKTSVTLYYYDPLDRLMGTHSSQRFYNGTRIATEINGERKTSFFEHQSLPLAERHLGGAATLMATDFQKTVLHSINTTHHQPQAYSPYGHRLAENEALSLLGFNGERPDPVTGHYLLGQGHRAYNPVLMRFNSPDTLSPFGKGGINAYAYCSNNPITRKDPTGKSWIKDVYRVFKNISDEADYPTNAIRILANKKTYIDTLDKATRGLKPEFKHAKIDRYVQDITAITDSLEYDKERFEKFITMINTNYKATMTRKEYIDTIGNPQMRITEINQDINTYKELQDQTRDYLNTIPIANSNTAESVKNIRRP